VVVEDEYETGFVEHAYIEPEAGFARRVGEGIEIQACTQSPYMDRADIAKILGIAPEAVRIIPTAVGGGFGSKLDLSVQPFLALAAWHLNRPVRMVYSRFESMMSTTKRHPARMHLRAGATRDGRLQALDFAADLTAAGLRWVLDLRRAGGKASRSSVLNASAYLNGSHQASTPWWSRVPAASVRSRSSLTWTRGCVISRSQGSALTARSVAQVTPERPSENRQHAEAARQHARRFQPQLKTVMKVAGGDIVNRQLHTETRAVTHEQRPHPRITRSL